MRRISRAALVAASLALAGGLAATALVLAVRVPQQSAQHPGRLHRHARADSGGGQESGCRVAQEHGA